ncbi:MAG: hypothetical protein Q7T53_05945 [Deltaproteobacteria bacterium]|nr:hypothetical protein [Deltaproteobacteria bacterium]
MKKLLLLMGFVLLVGCSSGGGGGSDSPTSPSISSAPSISNFRFSPSSATVGEGGGSITVTGYVDWEDKEGDIENLYVLQYDSNWNIIDTDPFRITRIDSTLTSGTVTHSGAMPTTQATTYRYGAYIRDEKGNTSNTLTGTFTVN